MEHPAESFREATRLISKSPNSPFGIENLRGINPPLPPFHKGGGRVLKSPLSKGDLGGLNRGTIINPPPDGLKRQPPFHKGGGVLKSPLLKGDLGGFFNGDLGGFAVGEGLRPSRFNAASVVFPAGARTGLRPVPTEFPGKGLFSNATPVAEGLC
jgi:hypothetical protein